MKRIFLDTNDFDITRQKTKQPPLNPIILRKTTVTQNKNNKTT